MAIIIVVPCWPGESLANSEDAIKFILALLDIHSIWNTSPAVKLYIKVTDIVVNAVPDSFAKGVNIA